VVLGRHLERITAVSDGPNVRPGQVWADNDKRHKGRTLRVERVAGGIVLCRIVTNTDTVQRLLDRKSPQVRDRRGKIVSIALVRFRPTAAGYRLIQDA
jgi:hypothetical protein